IFPSLAEGFGLPVLEAMYYGKPVFLSKLTSLPEVGGEHAYYFDNFSPEHMREVFVKGMHHYETTHPEAMIKAWALRFSWDNTAKEYLSLYRELHP
ncbi:MAG TPA: glycosyltransferase, partial [Ohtaekwangia sp.]|uniref:glycosyltransferase n=1 Tax=Ohtaekwangia sp. TaxID=2066019 RepID=UPI002F95A50B